jgi:hypothetical protein
MKVMLLEQKPTTYGIDRQIKTQIVRGGGGGPAPPLGGGF